MNKTLGFLFVVVFLGGLLFPVASLAVNSYEADGEIIYYKGLVPCGGLRTDSEGNLIKKRIVGGKIPEGWVAISDTEMARTTPYCQLCHFFVMIDGIIDFLLIKIVPALAALMIAIGGFMYIFAYISSPEALPGGGKGGPQMLSQAKKLFSSVVIGLLVIYAAFFIIGIFLQSIGLAEWTTAIYQNWWREGLFEIPCP